MAQPRTDFPALNDGNSRLTSPADEAYNCISWAADDPQRWWWPDPQEQSFWPPTVPRAESIDAFVMAFGVLGYLERTDDTVEAGKQKIAIFASKLANYRMAGGRASSASKLTLSMSFSPFKARPTELSRSCSGGLLLLQPRVDDESANRRACGEQGEGQQKTRMPSKSESVAVKSAKKAERQLPVGEVASAIASLKRLATKATRDGMARYAIPSDKAFGVPVGKIQQLAKRLGRNHGLAAGLWDAGWYEARMLAAYVDDPACVTPAQMDRWCRDFDNWAICDTVCFALFDRTPHAWRRVAQWSRRQGEFVKRAAFALLWGLSAHDKRASDEPFAQGLLLVERAATDERHFVNKAVNMALRAIGKRSPALNAAAAAVARRLADSPEAAARWVGKDALRELTSPSVTRRLAARRRAP